MTKDRNYYRMLTDEQLCLAADEGEVGQELCLVLAERLEALIHDYDAVVDDFNKLSRSN